MGNTAVFREMPHDQLLRLAEAGTIREFSSLTPVWHRGDEPKQLAFVLEGEVSIERPTKDGHLIVYRTMGRNSVVGVSIALGAPHTADVVARPGCQLLILACGPLATDHGFLRGAVLHLAKLIDQLSDEAERNKFDNVQQRLCEILVRHADSGATEVRITQQELADQCRCDRTYMNRVLAVLDDLGAIERRKGRILLCDVVKLENLMK